MNKTISIILVIAALSFFAFIILGITNYAGIGDAVGGFMQNSIGSPIRTWAFDVYASIGTSGWYMLLSFMVISIFGAFFWIPIFYNIFLKKGLGEKVLHRTPSVQPNYQNQPDTTTIPVTNLQSQPAATDPQVKEEQP